MVRTIRCTTVHVIQKLPIITNVFACFLLLSPFFVYFFNRQFSFICNLCAACSAKICWYILTTSSLSPYDIKYKEACHPFRKQLSRRIEVYNTVHHRVQYTECQALFQVVRIGSPRPLTRYAALLPHRLGPRGELQSLAREGVGVPNFDEGTDSLVLYVYYNPSIYAVY